MFNPASPASVLYHGTCADKTESPSPSLTEDDFDTFNNSNEGLRDRNQDVDQKDVKMGVLMPKMQKKRKRCGKCAGCTIIGNCGQCPPCNSTRTHQVCRKRRCMNLQPESVATSTTKKIRLNAQVGVDSIA
jgi:CXXC zinc finger domain.